jgi:isoleucyl-tRNA synthetase
MPFAQWGYHPDLGRGVEEFRSMFPADFIAEAIDQTRGWFYTLMVEGVLQFERSPYRNVVCLGHLIAEDGRKMSKSLGNQFDPWEALNRQGADALRWWMLTSGSPWESRRIGHDILDESVRQLLLPLWNSYAFFVTYANAADIDAEGIATGGHVLDRWIRSRVAGTVRDVRDHMEDYDATTAGRRIQQLVDDLSTWYIRRSRRRFWNAGEGTDRDAFATLHACLVTISQLLAPFTPFVAEELWRTIAADRSDRPASVHLSSFPEVDEAALDPELDAAMATARQVVELGRRVRVDTKLRTRQPLSEGVVHLPAGGPAIEELLPIVAEELNVHRVRVATSADALGTWRAKPDYRALGPRLGPRVRALAALLAEDDGTVADRLAAGEPVELTIDDGPPVTIGQDDVALVQEVLTGWGVASDAGITVALELALTPALEAEGLARELVRVVQDARRAAGLDVSDRIVLGLVCDGDLAAARDTHRGFIAGETLAVALGEGPVTDATHEAGAEIDGRPVAVSLRRAEAAP